MADPPETLTYLDRASVRRLLPSVEEQMDAIAATYTSMAHDGVENPPKIGVHARPETFVHAMPAYLRDQDVTAMKWVGAYPGNTTRGLPSISGLIVLNDSGTGLPLAVMDAAEITAVRTAAASGVSIRHLAHPGWKQVAILGYGEQGRRHVDVVRALRPDATIRVYAGPRATGTLPRVEDGLELVAGAREAVEGADVVVTAGPMTRGSREPVGPDWVGAQCLVVPVDFDAYTSADLVARADDFVVDDTAQFEHYRSLGYFQGWPVPARSLGAALEREPTGALRVSCSLGVGAIDAAVAHAVWLRALDEGAGVALPR